MLSIFKKERPLFALTLVFNVLFAGVSVGAAFVLQNILDAVIQGDWALFRTMLLVVPAYVAFVALVMFLERLCSKKLVMRTLRGIRRDLFNGILSRDTESYQAVNTADYISALTNDVKTLEENALAPLLLTIQYALVFLGAAVALVYYSPLVAGIMLLCLVAMYLVPASLGKRIGNRQAALSQSLATFTVGLKDRLSGYDVIRSFRLAERVKKDFSTQNNEVSEAKYKVDQLLAASEGLSSVLGMASQIFVMLVAGYLVLQGQLTAGVLLGILELSGSFVQPVALILQSIPCIQGARPVLQRIQALSAEQPSHFQGTARPEFEKELQFEKVSFGYRDGQPVLHGLDVAFEKNRKYAIVGPSGCGKTTLIRLLTASYGRYEGAITVDGRELKELDIHELLAMVSIIHQNVYMFDETIKENIGLHNTYPPTEWERALSVSGVNKFLPRIQAGLDSAVGENGVNLSGGQKQRVAVARALIQRKPILILDEGTSAIDARTAHDIETALLDTPDITMLTITHNTSAGLLRLYDEIIYMEDGSVAGTGDYDTLLRNNSRFAEFVQLKKEEAVPHAG